ncbi:hypothetical protein [Pedobacter frigoris]|uniref:Nuclear transport factor 2 family protein n=1 Tax=Pedobacter frigoris TaxID=2571272 RepID=A0A4U1CMM4_9SPHI|nr:hypothetical protein [Pedobacter frigoris]TKC09121.1 hypothetical protein FA047_03230 [Pedobacter frigoris]
MYLVVLSMAFTTLSAKADRPINEINVKPNSVIEAFVKANLNGNASLFNIVLQDGAVIKINRKDKVIQHSKSEIIDFYKKSGEIKLNCTTDFEILSTNDCTILARVDFKFPSFVQQNYISIEKDRKGAWKITNVNRFNV